MNKSRDGPRQRAKGARAPPGSKNFFFLVYKIFIKKAWALWFLAWAPLTSPIPVPASQPRSFQEPEMKEKKKKIKEKKGRGESETEKVRDPSRRDAVTEKVRE